jgi:hypothetical protein
MTPKLAAFLKVVCLALGLGLAALFCLVVASRMFYPYEIEFEEGDLFLTALRALDGHSVYPSPQSDPFFVPLLYTPFYYYICGFFILLLGRAIWVCRFVSVLATLGIVGMIISLARRKNASWVHALLAGSLFLAFFPATGYWYDLARLDMVFFALALGAFALLDTPGPSIRRLIAAGALLFLATFTKQLGVFYIAAAAGFLFIQNRRVGLVFGALTTMAVLLGAAIYHVATDGQFTFYTLTVGSSHALHWDRLVNPLPWLRSCWPLIIAAAMAIAFKGRAHIRDHLLWYLFLAASIPTALLPWAKVGNFDNDFIPLFLSLAVIFALFENHWAHLVALLQLALLVYNPAGQMPTRQHYDKGAKFISGLREETRPTYVLDHPYYSWLAGKPAYPKGMYIAEAQKAGRLPSDRIVEMVDKKEFARILVDLTPPFDLFSSRIMAQYKLEGELLLAPTPLTGTIIYPRYAMLPSQTLLEVDLFKEVPENWIVKGNEIISPPIPPECSSISFELDGRAQPKIMALLVMDGRILNRTFGVPGSPPVRARWDATPCIKANDCRFVVQNLHALPDGKPAMSTISFEL